MRFARPYVKEQSKIIKPCGLRTCGLTRLISGAPLYHSYPAFSRCCIGRKKKTLTNTTVGSLFQSGGFSLLEISTSKSISDYQYRVKRTTAYSVVTTSNVPVTLQIKPFPTFNITLNGRDSKSHFSVGRKDIPPLPISPF